jgi:hypothetical protein
LIRGRAPRALLLLLLLASLQPATALAADGDGEVTFSVPLQADHGLSAELEADDDEIDLTLRKRRQLAFYSAQGDVSEEGISVKFGRLGEFVVDYKPFRTLHSREPGLRCEGEPWTTTEGFFRGTLRFRGERDYVQIDATQAKGTLILHPRWTCRHGRAGGRARGSAMDDDEATLGVRRDSIGLAVFGARNADERPVTGFWAFSREVRDGLTINRMTTAGTGSAGFLFDNRRGTAFVDPPAPFTGSARYLRRPNGPDSWSGNLTVPLLGLGRVPLTGPGFDARMVPRYPEFR